MSPRLTFLSLLGLLCLLTVFGFSSVAPSPAEAHKTTCKKKRGTAKLKCAKRAKRHRRAHARSYRCGGRSKPCRRPVLTSTRGVGIAPVSDTEAANRVRPVAENRPANVDENHYRPTAAELTAFRTGRVDRYGRTMLDFNPLTAHVTGGFTGTTDEILQWAAHKWGIPEDVIRAAAVTESDWNMSKLGDRRTVADPSIYPGHSRIAGTSDVYESLGILQVKWNPDTHWGTEPLRWKSTAFNADYWAATVRYYYDGRCDWCAPGYSSGQILASVGAWYNPSPWVTGSLSYVSTVTANLAARRWERAGF